MNKLTSLGLSFDRVLIQLFIPGFVSIIPVILCLGDNNFFEKNFFIRNPNTIIILITISSLVIGMILENFGSCIEINYYDKKNKKSFEDYDLVWEKYLTLSFKNGEPIGHRYIRNILLRMKFELSFGISLIPLSIGLIFFDICFITTTSVLLKICLFCILPLALSSYLIFDEAYNSSKVLARTRKILVDKFYEKD